MSHVQIEAGRRRELAPAAPHVVHVKKAATSTAPLKHLFAQGVVAVETLRSDLEIRRSSWRR
ncbi:hypothetical protein OG229_05260 [Streptomyces platensis]|uniref:DUF6119 family protein n=1 Tax=Streptomyces platensis TaxID=58346 RepID=UPI002E14669C|nr:hypothetical protein OG229_05260 [Streptomyces platensis]